MIPFYYSKHTVLLYIPVTRMYNIATHILFELHIFYSYKGALPCPYEGDYRCPSSGVCIRSYEVCDRNNHCIDDEDEENCSE